LEELADDEFGVVICRRHKNARYVRLKLGSDGRIVVTLPIRAPLSLARRLIDDSRADLRSAIASRQQTLPALLGDGENIGHSHTLRITDGAVTRPAGRISGLVLEVTKPAGMPAGDAAVQACVRTLVDKALQKEARAYLPRRLEYLASAYGFTYERVRFGTQRGRWGSCSSKGTISLNVALMALPMELIDYVLIHELCHTKQMNHSKQFWALVEASMPGYKQHRKQLKQHQPAH
jgi:predicted metal-dependent hydrolase